MSCFGPKYNPNPTKQWYRFDNDLNNLVNGSDYAIASLRKGNILQYKKNSSNLTRNQIYSKIATGKWNGKKAYASQSESSTNFNVNSLRLTNYGSLVTTNVPRSTPVACNPFTPFYNSLVPPNYTGGNVPKKIPVIPPQPVQPQPPLTNPFFPPVITIPTPTETTIPDGGTLVCSVTEDFCTGDVISTRKNRICYPSTDSDIPGPMIGLCYDKSLPTSYPKQRRTYLAGSEKWPTNAKFVATANGVTPVNP